ncbi:hypothetical protein KIPB_009847 [Kipferlia bialata]|uniref:F5/8 type C domain-containing protein n=1 Tax=Kipferlia bialata TaxID=797122 RepID=A0A9K3GME7_9EUKA|nr:hypothetical protein KIPB_009847 [Kipferlia bialata]|eukprot:g9847.t1
MADHPAVVYVDGVTPTLGYSPDISNECAPTSHSATSVSELSTRLDVLDKTLEEYKGAVDTYRKRNTLVLLGAVVICVGTVVACVLISVAVRDSTDLYAVQTRVGTLSETLSDLSVEVAELEYTLSSDLADVSAVLASQSSDMHAVSATLSTHDTSIALVSNDVFDLQTRHAVSESDISSVEGSLSSLMADVDALGDSVSLSQLETDINSLRATTDTLTASVTSHSASLVTLRTSADSVQSDVDTLSSSLDTLSSSVTTQTTSLSTLSSYIDSVQSDVDTVGAYAVPGLPFPDVKAVLMQGVTVAVPFYLRSTHSTADAALAAVQATFTGVSVVEAIETDAAQVRFSSAVTLEGWNHDSEYALRIQGLTNAKCWHALNTNDGQYASVSFARPTLVGGVATAGRLGHDYYVTQYRLEYFDPSAYEWVSMDAERDSFQGNTDDSGIVLHTFKEPVVADRLRLTVETFHSWVSMRLEVYILQ